MHNEPSDVMLLVICSETRGGNIAALSLQCQASHCRTDFADTSYPLEKKSQVSAIPSRAQAWPGERAFCTSPATVASFSSTLLPQEYDKAIKQLE